MKALTKTVISKSMSIDDIKEELMFATDGNESRREDVLLAVVQELASAIMAIQKELEFSRF